jgi:hypothetical protein
MADAPDSEFGPVCALLSDGGDARRCTGVDTLLLLAPSVRNVDGGALSPGDDAFVQVTLEDPDGGAVVADYPQVCFASETPGVSIVANNPAWALYAIKPGVSATYSTNVHFSASLAPGTVVRFAAQPTAAAVACTNGVELRWDFVLP